jgi:hypothetical protein
MPIDAPSSTWFAATPEWGWLIVLTCSLGALAGGSLLHRGGHRPVREREDRPLARTGYSSRCRCW